MLKLKLQYFGHLMWRLDSLERTLMLGKIEGRRRRRQQRMRGLDSIINSMDMNEQTPGDNEGQWSLSAKSLQSCPTLWDPMDCSLPGSSVSGILQARVLEWVAISSSRGSSWPRDWTLVSYVSCIGRQVFTTSTTWEAWHAAVYGVTEWAMT